MSNGLVCGFVWWEWYQGRLQAHRCQNPGDVTWCTTHGVYILTAKTPIPKLAMDHLHFDRQ